MPLARAIRLWPEAREFVIYERASSLSAVSTVSKVQGVPIMGGLHGLGQALSVRPLQQRAPSARCQARRRWRSCSTTSTG